MAKFDTAAYAAAAEAFFKEHGDNVPSKDDTAGIRKMTSALADKLGEKHPGYAGLRKVGGGGGREPLRPSIARRFISIAMRPYVQPKVAEAEQSAETTPAEPEGTQRAKTAQSQSRKAARSGQQPVVSA